MSGNYTIQRFRDGWAIAFAHPETGKRRRIQLQSPDRPSAEAEARAVWAEEQCGAWPVGRIVAAYIDAREEAEIASTSRQRDAWKAMKPFWGDVLPELIDEAMARSYETWRNRSVSTIRYELSMLSVALRWAKKQSFITAAPEVWRPEAPDRKTRHLTRPQFRRFLDGIVAPHARLFVVLAIATCSRPKALLELQWSQIDFRTGIIDLNPPNRFQTRKRRPIVPIADYARPVLEEAFRARGSDYVIDRAGKPIQSIKKAFAAASERSKVKATPYTLRHTGAVWRAEDGIPMSELAQLMGHDDDRTTQKHYARYSPTYLRTAANAGAW